MYSSGCKQLQGTLVVDNVWLVNNYLVSRQCVVSDGGGSYSQLKTYVDHEL
jgi:hypothetical protein